MNKTNCFTCKHFKTTWNPQFPRSCEAYNFKTKEMPSSYILKATGTPCMQYASNQAARPKPAEVKQSYIDLKR